MTRLQQALVRFARWRQPGTAGGTGQVLVRCIVDPPATPEEIRSAFGDDLPDRQAVEL